LKTDKLVYMSIFSYVWNKDEAIQETFASSKTRKLRYSKVD